MCYYYMIQRNYGPKTIERPSNTDVSNSLRTGASTLLRGVERTAGYLAKQGVKEGAKILPQVGEYAGAGLAVALENPELAPAAAWAGKQGGKYLERQAGKFIDSI